MNNNDNLYLPLVIEKHGIKVALFNAAENGFGCSIDGISKGYAWLFSPILKERIVEYRKNCDYVMVFAHGGLENEPIPLPEWRNAYRDLIDLGVDAVIATHSHIIQAYEIYKDKPIYYSLGNFVYQENGYDPRSLAIIMELSTDKMRYSPVLTCYDRNAGTVNSYYDNDLMKSIISFNEMLLNEKEYIKYINKKCMEIYCKNIDKYYAWGECIYDSPFGMRLLSAISLMFRGYKSNIDVKYHNILIETNLWIAQRALYLLWRDNND